MKGLMVASTSQTTVLNPSFISDGSVIVNLALSPSIRHACDPPLLTRTLDSQGLLQSLVKYWEAKYEQLEQRITAAQTPLAVSTRVEARSPTPDPEPAPPGVACPGPTGAGPSSAVKEFLPNIPVSGPTP